MRRALIVVLTLSALSVAPARRAAAAVPPLPRNATISVPGHGWGHGRGMGQWGAKGMADAGKSWTEIVKHYYSGTTIGTRGPENIRVLVEQSPDVVVTADSPFTASWADGTKATTSTSSYKFLRVRYSGSTHRLERATAWTGPWTLVRARDQYVVFTPGTSMLQLVFNAGSVRYYRGKLVGRYMPADNMRTINDVSLDHYLYGVVPRESPASWPAEALRAQSVAARTYAVYKRTNARASGWTYDICATTSCQVYAGYAMKNSPSASKSVLEYASTNNAVNATSGKVLLYGGKPILAEFSSSTGGYSAPGSVPYQKAIPDAGDAGSPHHLWNASMKVSEIEARWSSIGRLLDVKVTRRNGYGDWGGRVLEMQMIGTTGTATITGSSFRSAFEWPARSNGVRSGWFTPRYWRGQMVSAPSSVSILQGETKTLSIKVKNTGSAAWSVGGSVRFATAAASRFANGAWLSSTRAATVAKNITDPSKSSVATGQVAEFRIPLSTASVAPGTYPQKFSLVADGASVMSLAFDVSVQVLVPWIEDAPNMLRNASFESSNVGWHRTNLVDADGSSATWMRQGARSLRITGGGVKSAEQTVSFAGGTARRFTFGGWNRTTGSTASGGPVEIRARARYSDGTSSVWNLPFARAPHAWAYDERSIVTSSTKQLASLEAAAVFADQTGAAYFDSLRMIETPVVNGSFDDEMTGWLKHNFATTDGPSGASRRDGARALALTGSGSKSVTQSLSLSGSKGDRFVLSSWNRAQSSDPVGGPIAVTLTTKNTDGTTTKTDLNFITEAHDWTFGEAGFRATKPFTRAGITISRVAQKGTQYFDDVRLTRTSIGNASFEQDLAGWSTRGFGDDDGISRTSYRDGARALRIAGSGTQLAFQQLPLTGGAGRRFVVSGWSSSTRTTPEGFLGLRVILRNADGSATFIPVPFDGAPHLWSYSESAFRAPKRFVRMDVYVAFANQTGIAFFDGIGLRNA